MTHLKVINIKISKSYRTTFNDALCILTGNVPIEIKAEETANIYRITRDKQNQQLDHETDPKDWTHPADSVRITDHNESRDYTFHIYTDGSKNEQGVGSGITIYTRNELIHQIKHKLHNRCSNNQAEQTAIFKAVHKIETLKLNNYTPRTVKIYTDSRITLSSLKNTKNRKHLIQEIRKKTTALENENWRIEFTWIKAHAGHRRNELADKLAKEAAKNREICFNKIPKSEILQLESQKSITK